MLLLTNKNIANQLSVWPLLKKWTWLMLLILFAYAASAEEILVGGTMTVDEVWTNENVYVVYKDLRIPAGITLSIQPGVTVKVDQGRGILVLGGNLMVNGMQNEEIDSVNFLPNHVDRLDGWKWKGISYTGVAGTDINKISFANITDAEIAIDIYNSEDILIENSCILNNQNIGVRLYNSKNCGIIDCLFQDNYDGIEMVATDGNETSGNQVSNCILKNSNHNIYLLKAYGGIFLNNLVENNLIEGGNNGIWMDNGGGIAFGRNIISKNIIINNGAEAGYGLLLSQDSITVSENIFWKNHISIYYDPYTDGSIISNNSFYQNKYGIKLSVGADSNRFINNTFASNEISIFEVIEAGQVFFNKTNIFPEQGQENIIINKTPEDIDLMLNYWHGKLEDDIQNLIWDHTDDPILGTVIYNPLLEEADTMSPISPPAHVIKQLINNQVQLSWIPNPESDQRTYTAYYGNFENYKFTDFIPAGNETSITLAEVNFSDSLAVTAWDNTLIVAEAQVSGHESPFAFATAYPFAGFDSQICKQQTAFPVEGSTIPFGYQSISWATNGDGQFNQTDILSPIYYPGSQDKTVGQVVLTLGVISGGKKLYDSLTLYIYDNPVAFAGIDTVIFVNEVLEIVTASAAYYESLDWVTTGDGNFNNDTLLNPVYTPGDEDIAAGEVKLILMAVSECGMTADTMTLLIEPFYTLEGRLWFKNQLLEEGVILAVKDDPGGARAIEMEHAGADGSFRFNRLMEGNYYVYAVPDTTLADGAVPGYYADDLRWQDAYYFTVDADIYDVDISLPSVDYKLPMGEAAISGYFEMPAISMFTENIYCRSWFRNGAARDYCDGGLSNITVFLYNSSGTKLLDFTLTDEHGNFYFHNLPYGGYIIDAEKAGYQTSVSSLINLSPDHLEESGIVLTLSAEKIGIYRSNSPSDNTMITVYPNPANSTLHLIMREEVPATTLIEVYDTYGREVLRATNKHTGNQNMVELDVSNLTPGIYLGKWEGMHQTHHFTFIKN